MASSPRIDELRKKFEENPRRYFAPLANEYRKAGEIEQAIAICREYLPQQPGHMSGHIVFGQALFEAKQLDEAKTVFETALSLDPENLIALRHLGDITAAAGDKEAAKGWYKRVLEADPRNEETQALLSKLEGPKPAAQTPATAQEATPVSKTMPMPAAKPAAGSSAPTVVMQAMRPLPKLGMTGVAMPAVPKPSATPTPIASLSSQPTVPFEVPHAAPAPAAIAPTQEIRMEGLTHGADSATKVAGGSTSVAATLIMETPHGLAPVHKDDAPVVTQAAGLQTTAVASSEAPPMDSFSLEGLETTSMAPPPPPPQPMTAVMDVGGIDLDFGVPAAPAPVAEAPAVPEIELEGTSAPVAAAAAVEPMPTIDLDFAAPAPPAPAASAPVVAAATVDESGLVDLDIGFPSPVTEVPPPVVAPAAPVTAAEPEPIEVALDIPMPVPVAQAPVESVAPVELEIEAPAPAPDSGPFVTETMAELYLKQGHPDEALRVYRALLEQRPGDAGITAKIAELSGVPMVAAAPEFTPLVEAAPETLAHEVPAPETPVAEMPAPEMPAPEMPALPHVDGPTIRAVLMLIAMRRPGYRPESGNGATPVEPHDSTDAPVATAVHGSDSLGSLWSDAPPSPDEENAALVLSAAFADLDGETHGNGAMDFSAAAAAAAAAQSATAAAMAAGAPAAPSSFSFDKFFSQRMTAEHAAQAAKPGAPVESKEDVAQFTQWLEGLKQR